MKEIDLRNDELDQSVCALVEDIKTSGLSFEVVGHLATVLEPTTSPSGSPL